MFIAPSKVGHTLCKNSCIFYLNQVTLFLWWGTGKGQSLTDLESFSSLPPPAGEMGVFQRKLKFLLHFFETHTLQGILGSTNVMLAFTVSVQGSKLSICQGTESKKSVDNGGGKKKSTVKIQICENNLYHLYLSHLISPIWAKSVHMRLTKKVKKSCSRM